MQNQVIADIEIGDQKIEYYSSVVIRQQFNAHHQFAIRISYDVLEKTGSFDLKNSQKLIGKSAIIKLKHASDPGTDVYEFRGIICEITMEQSQNFTSDLLLKGYSPTILLENGVNLSSFYKKTLKQIAEQFTGVLGQVSCTANVKPQFKTPLTYICQYKESGFHFLNRLSSDFGEWFYYDGKELFFGKPSSSPNIDITYGEDVHNIQFTLRILPLAFSSYSYNSKEDKFISSDAPKNIDGLDQFASFALQESNKIYSEPISLPSRQRVESKSDLEDFVKKQKNAMAANLEVLSGSSDNPAIHIGAIASVKFSALENNAFKKEDHGKFLITAIEHHITENGKYYNNFEAIPSGIETIPVKNITMPVAEPQIATVKDNKDPDGMGRVRVQMLWQQATNEMTDWIRVMTPDAGGGKGGAKNRGLVVVPESGDQVLVCFRYNDPDRPFVMGSMFHGKTGGGGGDGNKSKSLIALSGSKVSMDDKAVTIVDADEKSKVFFDGTGKIDVTGTETITITCGSSSINLSKDGKIDISGVDVTINGKTITSTGSEKAEMKSGPACFSAAAAGDANMDGTKANVTGTGETTVSGGGKTTVSAGGKVSIQGAIVALN